MRSLFLLACLSFFNAQAVTHDSPNPQFVCADNVAPLFNHGNFVTDANHYFLSAFLNKDASRNFLANRDYSKLVLNDFPPVIGSALTSRLNGGSEIELFQKFRSPEVSQTYVQSRASRHSEFVVPETRHELQTLLGYDSGAFPSETPGRWVWNEEKTWRRRIVAKSPVKNKKRVIYRPRELKISVAVTYALDGETVQETELSVARGDDSGNWDFYVYSPEGKLTTESTFAQRRGEITLASPYACMACHYNVDKRVFERFPANVGRNRKFLEALLGRP